MLVRQEVHTLSIGNGNASAFRTALALTYPIAIALLSAGPIATSFEFLQTLSYISKTNPENEVILGVVQVLIGTHARSLELPLF